MNLEEVKYLRERAKLPIGIYTLGNKTKEAKYMNSGSELITPVADAIDFLDTIKQLSSDPALQLLADLIQAKNSSSNLTLFDSTNLSPTEKNKVSKGYKQLEGMNLIVRVKREIYLVNPRISPPYPDYFYKVCLHWFQVTGRQP